MIFTARRLYVADGHILCGFDYLHALHTVHMQCGSNGGQRHVLTDVLAQLLNISHF